jgi:hypothetical protein
MESLRSAGFQPARGKSNEAGWKPALRIKIALGEFQVLPEVHWLIGDKNEHLEINGIPGASKE